MTDLIDRIETVAPLRGQAPWDNSGVQVIGRKTEAQKLAVALDPLPQTLAAALDWGADCILTHHPLSLEPHYLNQLDAYHEAVSLLLEKQAWLYAAHTSLDVQSEGPVGWLAKDLGLSGLELLEITHTEPLQGVRFQAGKDVAALAAILQKLPAVLHLQQPSPGEIFLVCAQEQWPSVKAVISQRLASPAFAPIELSLPHNKWGFGLVGDLPTPASFKNFCGILASHVGGRYFRIMGPTPETVSRVAYCTGSGGSLVEAAANSGADVFVTGDMKYHQALNAPLSVIDVGHFILEEEMMRRFAQALAEDPQLQGMELLFFAGQDPFDLLLLEPGPGEPL